MTTKTIEDIVTHLCDQYDSKYESFNENLFESLVDSFYKECFVEFEDKVEIWKRCVDNMKDQN